MLISQWEDIGSARYVKSCFCKHVAEKTLPSLKAQAPGSEGSFPVGWCDECEESLIVVYICCSAVKNALQMQDLEANKKLKGSVMADPPVAVRWLKSPPDRLGVVTEREVLVWSVDGTDAPVKLFDRHHATLGDQVMDVAASPDGKWYMLVGLKPSTTEGAAEGHMQLYSMEKKASQSLQAHAGCFASIQLEDRAAPATVFCFVLQPPGSRPKLQIIELGTPAGQTPFRVEPRELPLPASEAAATDFPVAMVVSKQDDILYIFTKMGLCYLFDVHSGQVLFRHSVSDKPLFAAVYHEASGGVLAVTAQTGSIYLATLARTNLVPYVCNTLRNAALAMSLASRLKLGGADALYRQAFDQKVQAGDIESAVRIAAESPNGLLRTRDTIARFQAITPVEGQQPPVMKYFALLMQRGRLNAVESVEVARPALAQGRKQLIEKWLHEDKITSTQELGDMVGQHDSELSLKIYLKGGDSHEKVIDGLLSTGAYDKVVPYAEQHGYSPNYRQILQQLIHRNPKAAKDFASQLVKVESGPPLIEKNLVVDIFMQFNRLQECTSFLLDALADDCEDEGFLQTRLLEMNLLGGAPQVVEAILASDMLHHYDRSHIAQLCEKAGLFARALEMYSNVEDIKRVMMHHIAQLPQDFLVAFFGSLTPEDALSCLDGLLDARAEALVVRIAQQYSDQLGPEQLIALLEAKQCVTGIFNYLGAVVNTSESAEVHLKYIMAATQAKRYDEVERVCRDSTVYDAESVKDFLINAQLSDPRPLIHVCDRNGFIDELTEYLWTTRSAGADQSTDGLPQLAKFLEVYVSKVSPDKAPQVVGKLLDLDGDETFIKNLLMLGFQCPVETMVEQVEKRNRLRLLHPWLEAKIAEGNTDAATHNAMGKIIITLNKDPQQFLMHNHCYDPRVLGEFAAKLDPFLAFLAYKRAAGQCDEELLDVTTTNGLFKDQARYLVEKQDAALWERVLADDNPHRQELVEQVISTALPETTDPDHVSTTVRAFMHADLPNHLIGLLEKLVLHGGDFSDNRNLQNLLILTAIRCSNLPDAEPGRAMDYIQRLDNFDHVEIAERALRDEYQLYEEALAIYKKCDAHPEAMHVLLEKLANNATPCTKGLFSSGTGLGLVRASSVSTVVCKSFIYCTMYGIT